MQPEPIVDLRSSKSFIRRRKDFHIIERQDQSSPINATRHPVYYEALIENKGRLQFRFSLGQRVRIRLGIDALVNLNGPNVYRRLRNTAVTLSCPNPEQAELAIEAILRFAESLDGKWLASETLASAADTATPTDGLSSESQER